MAAGTVTTRVFDVLARPYDLPLVQELGYRRNHDVVMRALARVQPARVLDVGCGTGILTHRIREELDPEVLVGVDPSAGMLARAQERDPSIDFREGRAEQLPLDDASVDAVTSTEAFHFFDQPAALAEFSRVLAPGGTLVVVSITTPAAGLFRHATGGAVSAPNRREVLDLVRGAALTVVDQRMVPRLLPGLFTSVATTARKPAA
ncbi:MAG: methyltransferase domain-containing protein [Aeromicrobium erythreum]